MGDRKQPTPVDTTQMRPFPPPPPPSPQSDTPPDWRRRFERSQQRWGNLKVRIKQEVASLSGPGLNPQQRSQYANGVARLNWVLHEMGKCPDVLAEGLAVKGVAIRKSIMAANGISMPDDDFDAIELLRSHMESMTPTQRVGVFQVLTDFFCPRCGIDQPYGDCQCQRDNQGS